TWRHAARMTDEERVAADAAMNDAWRSGARLPPETLDKMEGAFGADLAGIAVGEQSGEGSLASAGHETIRFAPGQYAPGTSAGDALIAHELAHVVQQRTGRVGSGAGEVRDPALEAEADRAGALAAQGSRVDSLGEAPPGAGARGAVQHKKRVPAWA